MDPGSTNISVDSSPRKPAILQTRFVGDLVQVYPKTPLTITIIMHSFEVVPQETL